MDELGAAGKLATDHRAAAANSIDLLDPLINQILLAFIPYKV